LAMKESFRYCTQLRSEIMPKAADAKEHSQLLRSLQFQSR